MHPGPAIASLAGVAVTVAPYLYDFGRTLGVAADPSFRFQPFALAAGCVALMVGGLTLDARRKWDQALLTAGVVAALAGLAPTLAESPATTLAVALLGISLVFAAWESDQPIQIRSRAVIPTTRDLAGAAARSAALTATIAELSLLLLLDAAPSGWRAAGLGLAALFAVRWCALAHRDARWRALGVASAAAGAGAVAAAGGSTAAHLLLGGAALALIPRPPTPLAGRGFLEAAAQHPAGPLVASFFVLCAGGAVLLHAPAATTAPQGVSSIDAVFTAVSAVCVTGLIVVDTPRAFTGVGQAILLLLIQLGALGIMSYSAAVILALGRRLPIRDENLITAGMSERDRGRLRAALMRLIGFTFGCEATGAAVLTGLFLRHGDPPLEALWRGAFTAVSAFCNAGFALQTDSLIPYQRDPWVLHAVGLLIVLGGLSPAAALAAPRVVRGVERSAQIKLILLTTAFLLVAGFVAVAAFEWNGALAGLPFWDRLHNAWLQSVTLRTAGFNSIAFDALRPVTLIVMMAAMFIGGSPGGTAGGVKTTTAAVMFLAVVGVVRGRREAAAFGRRLAPETIDRAAAITTLGLLSVFGTLMILLLTQAMPPAHAAFEAVSALATVGLSIGGTAQLDAVGKVIITFAMFVGRVGPLSMFAFLATRESQPAAEHPIEPIDVG